MNLPQSVQRCDGYTPVGGARPLAICRDCDRWLQRSTAGSQTPRLTPPPPQMIGLDQICVHRIPGKD